MAAEISLTYKEDKNCEAECHQISEALNVKARVIFPACCCSPHTVKQQCQGRAQRRLHRKRAAAVPGAQPSTGLSFLSFNLVPFHARTCNAIVSIKLWEGSRELSEFRVASCGVYFLQTLPLVNFSYWRLGLKVLNDLTLNYGEETI